MPQRTFKLDAPAPHLQRYEIKGRVERVGLPLYLIWANGIVFLGGFGGFAFFNTLAQDTQHDEFWVFAGAFIAGLFALIALVFHLKGLIAQKNQCSWFTKQQSKSLPMDTFSILACWIISCGIKIIGH
jgi:hypothetical protein